MKFIELQKYGSYSVVMGLEDDGNKLNIEPFVVAYKPTVQNGVVVSWEHGSYFCNLFEAVDYARQMHFEIPSYGRLEDIAVTGIYKILGCICDWDVITDEMELTESEMEYFGIKEDYKKYCEECSED